jgi:hypothetical protein
MYESGLGTGVETLIDGVAQRRYDHKTALPLVNANRRASVWLICQPPISDPIVDPLVRRERAQGFEPGFCPEPPHKRQSPFQLFVEGFSRASTISPNPRSAEAFAL